MTDLPPASPRSNQSPVSHEILKQQASVFDWISKNGQKEKDLPPPWFAEYMENYKDELTAEITAKVVHSLGIVIENKLAGFETKKTADVKVHLYNSPCTQQTMEEADPFLSAHSC